MLEAIPKFGNRILLENNERVLSKRTLWACIILTIIIVGRAFSNAFCYVFIAASVMMFLFFSIPEYLVVLVFLFPFSSILKFNVSGISFCTFLFFGLLIKSLISNKGKIEISSIISVLIFGIYALFISGLNQLTTVITMVAGFLIIRRISDYKTNHQSVIVAFSTGLVLSSLLSFFRQIFPLINSFILDSMMKLEEGVYATRFSGLQGNPNYYTMDIIFALACLAVLFLRRKQNITHCFLIGALSVFGFMSVSKSFLLSFALLIVLWLLCETRQGVSKTIKFVFLGIIVAGLVYYFAFDSINLFIFRLVKDKNGSLDSVTTGRLDIWKAYLDEIISNIKVLFLGNGLHTVISDGRGAHNSYIELFFSLGMVGTVLYLFALKISFNNFKWETTLILPVIILIFRMFAINLLVYDNIWIYFIILKMLAQKPDISQNSQQALFAPNHSYT